MSTFTMRIREVEEVAMADVDLSEDLTDGQMRYLCSAFMSPGSVGRVLAACATGAEFDLFELESDLQATQREVSDNNTVPEWELHWDILQEMINWANAQIREIEYRRTNSDYICECCYWAVNGCNEDGCECEDSDHALSKGRNVEDYVIDDEPTDFYRILWDDCVFCGTELQDLQTVYPVSKKEA